MAFNENESYQLEFRIRHRDGSTRWLWEQGRGIYDDDGNVVAFEGYVTDITDLHGVQDKLDLHHMYEELRSYAAPMKLECDVCCVGQIWRQAWSSLESVRAGREVRLIEADATNLECQVDAFRLEQVFRNLFENSLAACDDPVEISVGCHEATIEGRPALSVQISDNGPGLSDEQKSQVFDAFFTTKQKGTGLGMAIAQRILSAHFGTIAAGSGQSGGACFELCIPRQQP